VVKELKIMFLHWNLTEVSDFPSARCGLRPGQGIERGREPRRADHLDRYGTYHWMRGYVRL